MTSDDINLLISEYNSKYMVIKEQIYDFYCYLQDLQQFGESDTVKEKMEEIDKKIKELKKEKNRIVEKLYYYEELREKKMTNIIASDDEIELGTNSKKIEGYYDIWLRSINKTIGFIDYSKDDYELGNISYEIDSDYQGHNYAYKALVLLSNYLKEQGVKNISLAIRENNTPSIKTAEKFINDSNETIVKKNRGLSKNISMYYFKIGDEE